MSDQAPSTEPDETVVLTSLNSVIEAELGEELMLANNIRYTIRRFDDDMTFGPSATTRSNWGELRVMRSELERAQTVLEQFRRSNSHRVAEM